MKNNICLIANIGAHYRYPIFKLMNRTLGCDFYLGDKVKSPIKKFAYSDLEGYQKTLHNLYIHKFYWQAGSLSTLFKPYEYYFLDGEPYCISSWVFLLLARIMGKKTVSWSHGWYGKERGLRRIAKRKYLSLFTKLMLYSEHSIQLMEKMGFKRGKMFCIANSLDSDNGIGIRPTLRKTGVYSAHFGNEQPTVIYCGRIQKRKKLDMLIDVLACMKRLGKPLNLIVIGEDIEHMHLQQYACDKGFGNLWMYGPCYEDEQLGELFYNAAVCVSPGSVGLTAIQSLTFGCPVITHNDFQYQMPEFEAIHPGITGDFFEKGNIEDLIQKIDAWTYGCTKTRDEIALACYQEIDTKWNIHYQLEILKKVIHG